MHPLGVCLTQGPASDGASTTTPGIVEVPDATKRRSHTSIKAGRSSSSGSSLTLAPEAGVLSRVRPSSHGGWRRRAKGEALAGQAEQDLG
jgi:hypothetical protein